MLSGQDACNLTPGLPPLSSMTFSLQGTARIAKSFAAVRDGLVNFGHPRHAVQI